MAPQHDYYQVLGVPETATTDEIKKAFRRLAKQHHPDRNPNTPQSAERFKEINEAHDVLSDAAKRKKYDQLRRYGAFAGGGGGGRRGPGEDSGADFDLSDLGSFGGLGDIFSSIFGRRGGAKEPDVEEIETTVAIPFRVAARPVGAGAPRRARRSRPAPSARAAARFHSARAGSPSIARAQYAAARAPFRRSAAAPARGAARCASRSGST